MKDQTKEVKTEQKVELPTSSTASSGDEGMMIIADSPDNVSRTHAPTREEMPKWQIQFIEAFTAHLAKRPIVTEAVEAGCKAAGRGISRDTAYEWRKRDDTFRAAWDSALESGWDRAEGAAFTRAVEGIQNPIVGRDRATGESVIIGYETEYSDKMLELLLKGNRAEKYREKTAPLVNINLTAQEDALSAALNSGVLQSFFDRKLTDKQGGQ